MSQEVRVSVAEVCEVRGAGLSAPELLSMAALSADRLPPCPRGHAFDTEHVYLTESGHVQIEVVSAKSLADAFLPPEWATGGQASDTAAAVYCMGAVMRAAGAEEAADADLFSLVNVLCVSMIGTRPTPMRMGQMARNQLKGRDPSSLIQEIYFEIMGDEEENQLPSDDDFDEAAELAAAGIVGIDVRTPPAPIQPAQHSPAPKIIVQNDDSGDELPSVYSGGKTPAPIPPSRASHVKRAVEVDSASDIAEDSSEDEYESSDSDRTPSPPPIRPPVVEAKKEEPKRDPPQVIEPPKSAPAVVILETAKTPEPPKNAPPVTPEVPHSAPPQPVPNGRVSSNPFDDDDEMYHGGTLSGRDPFEQYTSTPIQSGGGDPRHSLFSSSYQSPFDDHNKPSPIHAPVGRRFSEEEEDIVHHTHIDEDDDIFTPIKTKKDSSYFEDIVDRDGKEDKGADSRGRTPAGSSTADSISPASAQNGQHASSGASRVGEWESLSDEEFHSTQSSEKVVEEKKKVATHVPRFAKKDDSLSRMQRLESTESDRGGDGGDTRRHVDAVVIHEQPRDRVESAVDSIVKEEDEEDLDTAFRNAIQERKNTLGHVDEARAAAAAASATLPAQLSTDSPTRFSRRNSLQANRISGRRSSRSMRVRKTRAVPEFIEKEVSPSIRLKAPVTRKKKMSLHRVEDADVCVELLNGQRVEVACRTDAIAADIFGLVVAHTNINEHVFFGITVMRDGEHFFLDEHQKLEKFAPPGWKNSKHTRQQYTLYLRFRFYPQLLEFCKTEPTMHALYLQCRRDILDGRVQPERDAAFEMAALALQAEFGDRPIAAVQDYFDPQHYLPGRFLVGEPSQQRKTLSELHGHCSGTKSQHAEAKFIQIAQNQRDFGAHLYRVYRRKPTAGTVGSPLDPDTGAALWVCITPRGISIHEEQGSRRLPITAHEWPHTQTLQFDKKKFVIVAIEDGGQLRESVYYTDHHSKSCYFVKFSASQHRFMMKMRQWKSTLRCESRIAALPDVAIEGRVAVESPASDVESLFPRYKPSVHSSPPHSRAASRDEHVSSATTAKVIDTSIASRDRTIEANNNDSLSDSESLAERLEEASLPEGSSRFVVELVKDPSAGLGLTLVDGTLKEVAGVYVKSVVDNGAGQRSGLCVGDRLLSVNGASLAGADRHRAVELVRESGQVVRLEVARIDAVAVSAPAVDRTSAKTSSASAASATPNGTLHPPTEKTGQSRTPPAPRRAANKRQRAVSDFGAVGDMLPALNTEEVLDMRKISGLHLGDSSDDERGEYRLPASNSMYNFHDDDDESPVHAPARPAPALLAQNEHERQPSDERVHLEKNRKRSYNYQRKSNLDWTDELEEVGEEEEEGEWEMLDVTLHREEAAASLGIQIASTHGECRVKAVTGQPASVAIPEIRVGDVLLSVNGNTTSGRNHQEVVTLLRAAGEEVRLRLRRAADDDTIRVTLNKQPGQTLGLSLAKRTGMDGMFVRSIGIGSVAEADGRIKVGDRIWRLDGADASQMAPAAIVEKLKTVNGPVHIVVKRS